MAKTEKKEDYKKVIYMSIIMVTMGVVFNITVEDDATIKPLGSILIGIGGFFFIMAMNRKRKQDKEQ